MEILNLCISGIRQNLENIRRVIVVSSAPFTSQAEWFDEKKYPFNKYDLAYEIFNNEDIAKFYTVNPSRLGWIYQQFLKLYASFVIPDISSNVLIIDADTIFLKPVQFLGSQGEGLYNPGSEYHLPYFEHASKLIPGLNRVFPEYSGISNHMLFQKEVIDDLFCIIQNHHNCEAWQAICRCIDHQHFNGSSLSEYEIYFNFVFTRTDQMRIRTLKWANISLNDLPIYQKDDYDFVSCHYYIR
ncbi:MAG: DUF6492 family protein [Parachlamydia sp.]|nr:DUF6492 family protein [Parachlamydia sp.]